jgi:hypothetical protein
MTTTARTVGVVYGIPPQPPDAANTRYLPAGAVTIGVEYRTVDPEALVATYEHDPEQLRELLERSPAGGFTDEGVSLHVCGTDDGHEYLRFDVFDDEPHYHYVHAGSEVVNNVVAFDEVAHGDMLTWALGCIRDRLPAMLEHAGGGHLVPQLDHALVGRVVDEVAVLAADAQRDIRAVRAAATAAGGTPA